jgi:hypothetical protein
MFRRESSARASPVSRNRVRLEPQRGAGTAKDRTADDTDMYAFVCARRAERGHHRRQLGPPARAAGGPNFQGFDDDVHYYLNVDNVGDALDHVRFEFTFQPRARTARRSSTTPGRSRRSTTRPERAADLTCTRVDDGVETTLADRPGRAAYVGPGRRCRTTRRSPLCDRHARPTAPKVFVGPRDDPFFVDLGAVFDLLTIARVPGNKGKGVDAVSGYNVMTIALQVPMTRLTRDGQAPSATNSVLGIYDSASGSRRAPSTATARSRTAARGRRCRGSGIRS